MASLPRGGCQICRTIVKGLSFVNEKIKKNSKLYVFFSIIVIEFLSIQIQNYVTIKEYEKFVYPLLTQIALFLIFVGINYHSERLRFCKRQKLIVGFLAFYYFMNIVFLLFPICWSTYSLWINYIIIGVISLLFIATWRNL